MLSNDSRRIRGIRGGYTLLEAVVAMTVLAAGIVEVVAGFSVCRRAASRCRRLDQVVSIARKELDRAVLAPPEQRVPRQGRDGQFRWVLAYTERPHGLLTASVEVSWMEVGEPQSYRLSRVFMPQEP
jgi:type II secretory pathway component PulJ